MRNKVPADAPPMDGQTAWLSTEPEPQESEAERKAAAEILRRLREQNGPDRPIPKPAATSPAEVDAVLTGQEKRREYMGSRPAPVLDHGKFPEAHEIPPKINEKLEKLTEQIQQRDKEDKRARKGPRKPRSPARTVCYVEKLFARFPLAQRKAMYSILVSVCEPVNIDERTEANIINAARDALIRDAMRD